MKRTVFRHAPLWCCVMLAAVLLTGCAADSTHSSPLPTDTTPPQTIPIFADDGKLRLLYNGDYGTTIPFRGVTPLNGSEDAQTVWLLTDYTTDEYTHYATNTPQNDRPHQYRVYDADGTLVYDCGAEEPLALLGDWLLLSEPYDGVDQSAESVRRMVHLKTGESKPLPGGSPSVEPLPGGGYALNGWNEDYIPYCYLLDDELNEVAYLDNAQLYVPYQYEGCGWLELSRQVEGPYGGYAFETALYDPATGAELTGYTDLVGHGIACRKLDGGMYDLYDLATGTVLATGGQRYLLYHNGIVVTDERDGPTARDNEGNVYHTESWTMADDGTLVIRSAGQTDTRVYTPEGTLLYSVKNVGGDRPEALNGGRFLATVSNWQQPQRSYSTLYGPEGVIFQTEKGSYISQRTDSYLVVTRLSYANSYRYDIYDYNGNLLVESLAGLPGMLEENLLPARRGYTIGWMDLQGNWLWSQRMFTGIEDEKDYDWY